MISSYPSIYALGHRAVIEIFKGHVVIEEKIDGSQFSMSKSGGELTCRSKGANLVVDEPEKMFSKAVETAKSLDLRDGWVYRCEYLKTPKHNTLSYTRHPNRHIIVFDVMTGPEIYLTPSEKKAECDRLGLECVPCYHDGEMTEISKGKIEELLHNDSVLGGCKVEGVVVKNYNLFTADKKIAVAKFVSEAFKEKHAREWKASNPSKSDIQAALISELRTEARWRKGVQHLKEAGKLTESPRDIGNLIKEVQSDVLKEEEEYIKDKLFKHFWPHIARGIINGLPEWYKEELFNNLLESEVKRLKEEV